MKLAEQGLSPSVIMEVARRMLFDLNTSQQRTWKGFVSLDQSSWFDTSPFIRRPRPSEFNPIFPPTTPASVKQTTSGPSELRILRNNPCTSGIQSQFWAIKTCPFSTASGSAAKAVQPEVRGIGLTPILANWLYISS